MTESVSDVERNVAIAAAIERGITSQSELLISLSLAIIGGLLALRLQLLLHNANQPATLLRVLPGRWFIPVLLLPALTILLGFSISGKLLTLSPTLYGVDFRQVTEFKSEILNEEDQPTLLLLARAQVVSFVLSAILAAAVLLLAVSSKVAGKQGHEAGVDQPDETTPDTFHTFHTFDTENRPMTEESDHTGGKDEQT